MIYADNAATTKLDLDAYELMIPFLLDEYGNASSQYSFAGFAKKAIINSRNSIASGINSDPDEIFFTSGGTESDNWAIKGSALIRKDKGKHIITSSIEHHAVLESCAFLEFLGFDITYLPVDKEGYVKPEVLKKSIRPETVLVSIMFANNEIGTIQKIKELTSVTHLNGSLFHCDAVQAVGHLPIDVKQLGIDLLSASAHKFNGPKGVGFLFIKKGTKVLNWASGGKQELGYRAGTENVAGIVGMAKALTNNIRDLQKNEDYLNKLTDEFVFRLSKYNVDFIINGGLHRLPGNVNLSFRNCEGEVLLHRLDLHKMFVSTGSACTSGKAMLSHVIQAIGTPGEYAYGTIRISFGKDNSRQDVILLAETIAKIVESLKK